MAQKKKLGEILVEEGILSPKTRDRILQRAQFLKRRFGRVLEDLELVTGDELARALALQHGHRTVNNLARLKTDRDLLKFVPMEVALENLIFPLKLENDRLALAMSDPTDTRVARNIAADNNMKVVPFVASKQEIRSAISRHYLGKEASRPEKRTVLAVDDDKMIRDMLGSILKKEGHRVLTAKDGMEAFRLIISESPHVVVSDMVMPKLDGYNLLGALKNIPETSFIPVIMISGQMKTEEEEVKAFEKGFFDVIRKPFNDASVRARVRRAFHFYDNQYRLF
ncbi:MAG: response regulator [Desulfuromonadales bacterium]|nr:response regulator [Desulfuromonadales bacterium]NIR33081.1 response regulator [Desulfuromonadales bacterium]NIS39319.1 response regulator [Desulfuromonadales bacterium]